MPGNMLSIKHALVPLRLTAIDVNAIIISICRGDTDS